jgi:hypothetical protein
MLLYGVQVNVACRYSSTQWEDVDERRVPLKQLRVLEGAVDDPLLANPRRRLDMLGTGWFGVIVEYEGVLVESAHEDHVLAWREVCRARGANPPPHFMLERSEGMKSEQVRTPRRACGRISECVPRHACYGRRTSALGLHLCCAVLVACPCIGSSQSYQS